RPRIWCFCPVRRMVSHAGPISREEFGPMQPVETGAQVKVREGLGNGRQRTPSRSKRPRSAVTSGRKLFVEGDPNSAWSRRFHDLVVRHTGDLGGRDMLSEAQFSLIRRATSIECELERLDAMMSIGVEVDLDA